MAEFEFAGMSFKGGKMFAILTALSTLGGATWGGFEIYKDYMDMKEIIQEIDTDAIAAKNNEIQIKLEQAIEYTRDIKNDLREDIMAIEATADRVEDDTRALEIRVNEALDAAELRIRTTQSAIDKTLTEVRADMDQINRDVAGSIRATEGLMRDSEKDVRDTMREVEERIDTGLRTLRTDLETRLQEALDNPLAQ